MKYLDTLIKILEGSILYDDEKSLCKNPFHDRPCIRIDFAYNCAEDMLKEFKEIKEKLQWKKKKHWWRR